MLCVRQGSAQPMDTEQEGGQAEGQGAAAVTEDSLLGLLTQRAVGRDDASAAGGGGGRALPGPSEGSAFQAVQPQSQGACTALSWSKTLRPQTVFME